MVQRKAPHQDAADLLAPIVEVIGIDLGPERAEPNREVIGFHLAGQKVEKTIVPRFRAVDQETVSGDISGAEEREPLDMVPVRVTEEQMPGDGNLAARQQVGPQLADSRARVANVEVIAESDFDAGRVAAVFAGAVAGSRDGPARAPELHVEIHR